MLIADMGSSLNAETATLLEKVNDAVMSGSAHDIKVEMAALQTFYENLWQVEGVLKDAQQAMQMQAGLTSVGDIGVSIREIFDGSVPGVDEAVNAALDNVSGATDGLGKVLPALHAIVIKNLRAVYDTYMAYLNADDSGASRLNSAANQAADQSWTKSSDEIYSKVSENARQRALLNKLAALDRMSQ